MVGEGCLVIDRLWSGEEAWAAERAEVRFALGPPGLRVQIEAPFHGDPGPAGPPGRLNGLWNYEVVELFLANEEGHYLELEFGPHGHYLALRFAGARQLVRDDLPVVYRAEIAGRSWRGWAETPLAALPLGSRLANAYAIHGQGEARRYLAAHPLAGSRPDFHQPHRFQPW